LFVTLLIYQEPLREFPFFDQGAISLQDQRGCLQGKGARDVC